MSYIHFRQLFNNKYNLIKRLKAVKKEADWPEIWRFSFLLLLLKLPDQGLKGSASQDWFYRFRGKCTRIDCSLWPERRGRWSPAESESDLLALTTDRSSWSHSDALAAARHQQYWPHFIFTPGVRDACSTDSIDSSELQASESSISKTGHLQSKVPGLLRHGSMNARLLVLPSGAEMPSL